MDFIGDAFTCAAIEKHFHFCPGQMMCFLIIESFDVPFSLN